LAQSILNAKAKVRFCEICFNISDEPKCSVCVDERRDRTTICVVEESRDIVALEKTGVYRGLYHVLLGAINPLEGIGVDQLKIRELMIRINDSAPLIQEVILSTNPNTEGDVTAMYLQRLLAPFEIKVTKLASGLPVGGDLEYADELTLGRAIEGRREVGA
jgi:recombination protein RecR